MPRSFSSFSRSVSCPVSARTSAVLPWSMWPAVPMIERHGQSRRTVEVDQQVVGVEDAAQVEQEAPVVDAAEDRRARGAEARGDRLGAERRVRRPRAPGSAAARPAARRCRPRHSDVDQRRPRSPAPSARRSSGATARPTASISVERPREPAQRRQRRARDRAPRGRGAASRASAASVSLSGRSARVQRVRARGARSALARPTMMPACGPPSSLSPLKVTRSAPGRDALAHHAARAAGRSGARSTSAPLPRSSITGTPRRAADRDQRRQRRPPR